MPLKWVAVIVAFSLAAGVGIGLRAHPAKVVHDTVTKTQYVTQVVTKRVEVRTPDGTDTITTTTDRDTHATKESDHKDTTTYDTSRWHVAGLAAINPLKAETPAYGILVDYRLLGPISVGGFGLTNGTLGIEMGVRF